MTLFLVDRTVPHLAKGRKIRLAGIAFHYNEVYFFCVNESFTRILEINGHPMADLALHLTHAPIALGGVLHQGPGG